MPSVSDGLSDGTESGARLLSHPRQVRDWAGAGCVQGPGRQRRHGLVDVGPHEDTVGVVFKRCEELHARTERQT